METYFCGLFWQKIMSLHNCQEELTAFKGSCLKKRSCCSAFREFMIYTHTWTGLSIYHQIPLSLWQLGWTLLWSLLSRCLIPRDKLTPLAPRPCHLLLHCLPDLCQQPQPDFCTHTPSSCWHLGHTRLVPLLAPLMLKGIRERLRKWVRDGV